MVAHPDRAEPDAACGPVAHHAVLGGDGEGHLEQGLVAEFERPPELGAGHAHGPLDAVLAGGQRLLVAVVDAQHRGVEHDLPGPVGVDHGA